MKITNLSMICFVLVLVVFQLFLTSCGSANPKVIPASTIPADESDNAKNRNIKISEDNIDLAYFEKHEVISRNVCLISEVCEHYCDANLKMPMKIEDAIADFMFIWPANAINGGPMKILNENPENTNLIKYYVFLIF